MGQYRGLTVSAASLGRRPVGLLLRRHLVVTPGHLCRPGLRTRHQVVSLLRLLVLPTHIPIFLRVLLPLNLALAVSVKESSILLIARARTIVMIHFSGHYSLPATGPEDLGDDP